MGAFLAIEVPDDLKAGLEALRNRLRKSGVRASWVATENMHLTLRFLGDIPENLLDALRIPIEDACAACSPLQLAIIGAGAFPNPRRPSVLWAGVQEPAGALTALQARLEAAARTIGLPPEKKPFHPHITLARIKDPRHPGDLPSLLEAEAHFAGGDFCTGYVTLFSSELTRRGAVYRRLQEFSLTCLPS
jgi:RNA 2',3'-cyclic 3'-phosphodiesterase